jgi:hypothetical protein
VKCEQQNHSNPFHERGKSYRGKSPARRDKRDMLYNVLVSRAVYLLPVHGPAEKEHGLGFKPCSFLSKPCSFWVGTRLASRNWNTCKSDIFGTGLASRLPHAVYRLASRIPSNWNTGLSRRLH